RRLRQREEEANEVATTSEEEQVATSGQRRARLGSDGRLVATMVGGGISKTEGVGGQGGEAGSQVVTTWVDYSGSSEEIAATVCRLLKRKGGKRRQAVGRRERRGDGDRGGHDRGGCGWEDATAAVVEEEREMMVGGWEEKRLRKGAATGALGVGDSKEEVVV
ncbi:hypothetical protein BHE74_00037051, partial [Ensete ventricosum]